jgi:hypothetical protein
MSSNEVTEQQITSLIDELFERLPEIFDDKSFFRVKTKSGDAIQFSTSNHTGVSYHIFELNHIARLCLQNNPPQTLPGFALMSLGLFISRLVMTTQLAIDNANEISNLEAMEFLHLMTTGVKKKAVKDVAFEIQRKELLKRVEVRNKVMARRKHGTSFADTSIPRLVGALTALRIEKPNEEITIGHVAAFLGCEDDAVYRAISRYGISAKDFFNADPREWVDKRVDKYRSNLSKINSLPDDEK